MTPVLYPGDLVYIAVPNPYPGTPAADANLNDITSMLTRQGVEVASIFQTDNPRLTHPEIIAIFRHPVPKSTKETHD